MLFACSWARSLSVVSVLFVVGPMTLAQRTGGRNSTPSTPRTSANSTSSIPSEAQALYIRGKVALQDGTSVTEPIAIERVCNGAIRKEGYTDFKGNFEIQLGQGTTSRDATESGGDVFQNSGNRAPTQGMGSEYGIAMPSNPQNSGTTHPELLGCELRAELPGFSSSSVLLRVDGSSWDLDIGTIVLTRLNNVEGTTISLTTMGAPPDAKHAYEKGEKAVTSHKFPEAKRELEKAVGLYPQFAAAWSMLGEMHRAQNELAPAKEAYARAIAADPQYVNPYFGMAILAVHEKNWDDTLKYTDQVAKLNPAAFPLIYMYNAAANFYLGKLDAAEESARRFKQLDSNHQHPDSALLLSNILAGKRDYNGAAQELQQYLQLVPNAANATAIKNQLKQLRDMSVAKHQ